MRKVILAVLTALFVIPAHADGHHHGGGNWVAPFVGGAVIGAIIAQPRYIQPPVVYNPPVYFTPGTVYPDYIYRPVYREVSIFVPECNCYRTITVQVN